MLKNKTLHKLKEQYKREEIVIFLKNIISEKDCICPICERGKLKYFHKKRKKNKLDLICEICENRFDVVDILDNLN